jgi:hypothetical protein
VNAPAVRQSFCRVCNETTLEQITDTDYDRYMPNYQFSVGAGEEVLAGYLTVSVGAGEEVLAGYLTARVGQQTGERS